MDAPQSPLIVRLLLPISVPHLYDFLYRLPCAVQSPIVRDTPAAYAQFRIELLHAHLRALVQVAIEPQQRNRTNIDGRYGVVKPARMIHEQLWRNGPMPHVRMHPLDVLLADT